MAKTTCLRQLNLNSSQSSLTEVRVNCCYFLWTVGFRANTNYIERQQRQALVFEAE